MSKQTAKEKKLVSDAMSLLGQRTSKRKARSSAANGKLGGRQPTKFDPVSVARRKRYAEKKAQVSR